MVTGRGHIDTIAQNGIVILFGATALIQGNAVPQLVHAKGHGRVRSALHRCSGVEQQANSLSDNEVNLYNVGGGGATRQLNNQGDGPKSARQERAAQAALSCIRAGNDPERCALSGVRVAGRCVVLRVARIAGAGPVCFDPHGF